MSIKLMKQRWLVEEMDVKDSTEIVDMDIDEKDEYEIIPTKEKPANFLTQRGVENEKPRANVMDAKTAVDVTDLKVKKKPSRWDVRVPSVMHGSNISVNTTSLEKRSDAFSVTKSGISEKILEDEKDCSSVNEMVEEKDMKFVNNRERNGTSMPLDEMAFHLNPVDMFLPPGSLDGANLSSTLNQKRSDGEECINSGALDTPSCKPKVVMKWKCSKTNKEFSQANVEKLWKSEMESHVSSTTNFEGPTLAVSDSFVEDGSVTKYNSVEEDSRNHNQTTSPSQHSSELLGIVLPSLSIEEKADKISQLQNVTSYEGQKKSSYIEGQDSKKLSMALLALNEQLHKTDEDCTSETAFFDPGSQCHNHSAKNQKTSGEGAKMEDASEESHQSDGTSEMGFPTMQKIEMSSEFELSSQHSNKNTVKFESTLGVEQGSSGSSLSSTASPVSVYSFSSTPKTFSSPDASSLQNVDRRKQIGASENAPTDLADITANNLPLSTKDPPVLDEKSISINTSSISEVSVKPCSQPTPYEQLDDNVILCDESLIKEAKVVRCFCEPTADEIAEGRGCSSGCINRELYTECGSRCPSGNGCANRRFHNKQYAKVEVFDAGVKGWGLRAVEPLEPGRFIIEYVGEVIDAEEMIRRGRRYGKDPKHVHHYLMALKNGAVIDATIKGNVSRFINHSCDPNCESQKWTVDRQLRVGFFAIKQIAAGEEIVFDYQLERYGRKAQRCYCGAANCRGRIGDEESEEDEDKINDDVELEGSEEDDESHSVEQKMKSQKKSKSSKIGKKKKKQTSAQRYNKAIINTLSRGPPRNRTQIRDLVRLMVQVEQAPQRSSLIQCVRFAHPDVLRLFIQECGLRLLYVFLATDYPIDDKQSVLELQIKSLDLLDVMPIVNKNQINDSQLAVTVQKIAGKRGPIDEAVEDVVRRLVYSVCCELPSTSKYVAFSSAEDQDPIIERLHCEMVSKAAKLIEKWKDLREEFRIPRLGRTESGSAQHDISRYVRRIEEDEKSKRVIVDKKDDGSTLWRLNGFTAPSKRRYIDRRRIPKSDLPIIVKDLTHLENEDFKQSPIAVTDLPRNSDDEIIDIPIKPKKRRTRFDVVGERNPSSMYELYATDSDPYLPPPPTLLPEAMFAGGLPDSMNFPYAEQPFPEFFDWNAVYAKYDPSSAAYQQFIDYYQQQQYPVMAVPPCPPTQQKRADLTNILEAPSPPPPKRPKTPEEKLNMLTIGPIDRDNPTEEDIELLEKHLNELKAKRAEIRKHELEQQKKSVQEANETNNASLVHSTSQTKQSLWVQATTEEGAVYYYNKETRESVWTLPDGSESGNASADTTTDRIDTRAAFKAEIVKYVGGMLEPIRKLKFASADDYKYVLRKLTHTILEKELKRVGEAELKVTESVRDKARKFVTEYLSRLGDGQYSRKNKVHNSY